MTLLQCISLFGSLFFLLMLFYALQKSYLREGYALLWLFIDIGMVVLSIVPKSMDWIAKKLGIHVGPFVLVLFMLGGMILILFQQSIALSRHNEKIKRLAEELTLLREKVAKNKHEE